MSCEGGRNILECIAYFLEEVLVLLLLGGFLRLQTILFDHIRSCSAMYNALYLEGTQHGGDNVSAKRHFFFQSHKPFLVFVPVIGFFLLTFNTPTFFFWKKVPKKTNLSRRFQRRRKRRLYKAKTLRDFTISSFSKEISEILLNLNA